MSEANRHQVWIKRLKAVPKYGLPDGGVTVTYSETKGEVEAGYLWIGGRRQPSHKTISRLGGSVLVDLDAHGNFIGLEMLRTISAAEARRFYRWAHTQWEAPADKPHWPCSAMLSLLNAWRRALVLACPHCREAHLEDKKRARERAADRQAEESLEVQWTAELVH